jgi:hypothetical protein
MKTLLKTAMPQRHVAPRRNDRRLTGQHPRRRFLHLAAGAAALPTISRMAWAQAYPTRPVRIRPSWRSRAVRLPPPPKAWPPLSPE